MVERKLFVVGEAVTQLKNRFADVADIAGFQNLLAHGYFALDHRRVHDVATSALPPLLVAAAEVIKHHE